ncbi:MAG: hypothetical protein Kapaf2KO_11020 [Candidatus Kapaibacteriales bacterium]
MKKLILILLAALTALPNVSFAQDETPEYIKNKLLEAVGQRGSTLGTEFIISIPPNERESWGLQSIAVYVAAAEETEVTFSTNAGQFSQGIVPKNDVALFSSSGVMYDFSASYENWDQEQILANKAVIIRSKKPVSVYVMNSKNVSTEGYLAIPVANWGKEYIHCAFWDFREGYTWGSGFQVMASEDDTRITIDLRGQGAGVGETFGGRTVGDRIRITLDRGEMYQIQGNGETRGVFDLSGSKITATKPIGIISYHNRTMIPKFVVTSGRDHLCAMMPPIQAWGKQYASIELQRNTGGGDYFRVVSSEDNNKVTFNWYDPGTNQLTSSVISTLDESTVWSPFELDADDGTRNGVNGVNGVMLIKAEKPIFVMQYSYSANWDRAGGNYDPFMFPVTAVEQFTTSTIFQSPKNYNPQNEYNDNYFNILFVGDTTDAGKNLALARSILLDGSPITTYDAQAATQRIPTTNIYYAKVRGLEQGVHRIFGNAPFGGYVYGFASFDSYGWPAATNYANLDIIDPWAPVVEWEQECTDFYFDVSDMKPEVTEDDLTKIDVGLNQRANIITENNQTFNFKLGEDDIVSVTKDKPRVEADFTAGGPTVEEYSWRYSVDDPYQDAKLTLQWVDAWDPFKLDGEGNPAPENDTIVVVEYIADKISLTDEDDLDWDKNRVGNSYSRDFVITIENQNLDNFSGFMQGGIFMSSGNKFTVTPGQLNGNQLPITITYTPIEQYPDLPQNDRYETPHPLYGAQKYDFDTLNIATECLTWVFEVTGQGTEPQLVADDWDAGILNIGQIARFPGAGNNYVLKNRGTDPTNVTGVLEVYELDATGARTSANLVTGGKLTTWQEVSDLLDGFNLTVDAAKQDINFQIPPRPNLNTPGTYSVGQLTFQSTVQGVYSYEILFEHDASQNNLDEIAFWKAEVIESDVKITTLNWEPMRVGTYNTGNSDDYIELDGSTFEARGFIRVTNDGNAPFAVKGIMLENANGHYIIDNTYNGWQNRWEPTRTGVASTYSTINFEALTTVASVNEMTPTSPYVLEPGAANSLMIPVIFQPQPGVVDGDPLTAQVVVYGRTFQTTETIEAKATGALSGSAYEPTIAVSGADFDRTREGTLSPETDNVLTITNNGAWELNIFEFDTQAGDIFIGADKEDFGIKANTTDNDAANLDVPITDFIPAQGIALAPGEDIQIPVYFRPNDLTPDKKDRNAQFTVLSDAKAAEDDPNDRSHYGTVRGAEDRVLSRNTPPARITGDITGEVFNTSGLASIAFDVNTAVACDVIPGTITFSNTDTQTEITLAPNGDVELQFAIDGAAVTNPATLALLDAAFVILNRGNISGTIVPASGEVTFDIEFIPAQLQGSGLIGSDIQVSLISSYEFQGQNGPETVEFNIPFDNVSYSTITSVIGVDAPANIQTPGNDIDVTVRLQDVTDMAGANLTRIEFQLTYNSNLFFYNGQNTNLPNGWNLVGNLEAIPLDDNYSSILVRLEGNQRWPDGATELFRPNFKVLISDQWTPVGNSGTFESTEQDLFVDEQFVDFGDRSDCVTATTETSKVSAAYCIPDFLNTEQNPDAGNISAGAINPNVISTGSFEYEFSTPYAGDVEIRIIDNTGKVLLVPYNQLTESGDHKINVDVDPLSSGAYNLVIEGPRLNAAIPFRVAK